MRVLKRYSLFLCEKNKDIKDLKYIELEDENRNEKDNEKN